MYRLGLVGGVGIAKYTVADKVWAYISEVSGVPFTFEIVSLNSVAEAEAFYTAYRAADDFVGFNIALPWKRTFAGLVDHITASNASDVINTVYKNEALICGDNTDPLGIVRGSDITTTDFKSKTVLILGAGGGGRATAAHLSQNLNASVYLYDVVDHHDECKESYWLSSLAELRSRKYDLIINATPLGKYYFDRTVEAFSSPLDIDTSKVIAHQDTIVQEMNYLPLQTLFLQLGAACGLRTVSGERMLVLQAVESFQRYFRTELSQEQVDMIIQKTRAHILRQESAILEHSNIEDYAHGYIAS